ncbi:hypothetical protein B0H10DRAFT_1823469, partial [Mycena sp. CBHHK59/15]
PTGPTNMNIRCVLTVHPQVALTRCSYSHIIDGEITPAAIEPQLCPSRMVIHVPVESTPATLHKAVVLLCTPHNDLMHPTTKPRAEDKLRLGSAIKVTGLTGLTVQKLLNGELSPSTSSVYGGKLVAESSPAYMNTRKVRQFISTVKKIEHPKGMDWEVEGKMDEWEVIGFVDRFKKRYTLASLYCDTKNTEAFTQLFIEFFDTIYHVMGEHFKLALFYPDAKCRIVMLDGEVPQALGFGAFLAHTITPKSLPEHIPRTVIARLKSILGLKTQKEINEWHEFCAAQEDTDIQNWYKHKLANPWILPAVNRFLSKIDPGYWDTTPNHSNYVESAHAARNAETGIRRPLLTAILNSCDNIKVLELAVLQQDAVMPKQWNGSAEWENTSAQRKIWAGHKAAERNDQFTSYDTLKLERDTGAEDSKASLERQSTIELQIKSLQEQMRLDWHCSDLKEQVVALRREVDNEKSSKLSPVFGSKLIPAAVPDFNSIPFSLQDDSFDNAMNFNSTFNSNETDLGPNFLDEFLANLNSDLSTSMFADPGLTTAQYGDYPSHDGLHISGEQSKGDYLDYSLEYIGLPMASALDRQELFMGSVLVQRISL